MCGIFGWQWRGDAVPPRDLRVRLATLLGDRNDNRGGKSWGWAALPTANRQQVLIDKGLGLIVGEASNMATHSSLMGHTRQPTTGAVVAENSHPFEIGGLVGAHNGMVHNYEELEKKYPERKAFRVDSQHIFAHLAEGKDMKELECYGVIEWVETTHPDTFLLCKMTASGDLDIVQTKHGIVWSSNESHLLFSIRAAGMEIIKRYSVKTGEVVAVQAGKLWDLERKIEVSTYSRSSYSCTNGGSTSGGGMYGFGASNEEWNERSRKRKKDKNPESVCKNDVCGSPVTGGICTMMFDESCTGADLMFAVDTSAMEAGMVPDDAAEPAKVSGAPVTEESSLIFADAYVKAVCQASCTNCKAGDVRVGHYHVRDITASSKTYLPCHGPDQFTVKTFLNTRALMGEIQDPRAAKLTLAEQKYGWATLCDGKLWSATDLYALTSASECKMCHDIREMGSPFCTKHKASKAEDGTCAEPLCLIKLPKWDSSATGPYCRRHSCETPDCNGLAATGLYCPDCRTKREVSSSALVVTTDVVPVSTVSAATKAN